MKFLLMLLLFTSLTPTSIVSPNQTPARIEKKDLTKLDGLFNAGKPLTSAAVQQRMSAIVEKLVKKQVTPEKLEKPLLESFGMSNLLTPESTSLLMTMAIYQYLQKTTKSETERMTALQQMVSVKGEVSRSIKSIISAPESVLKSMLRNIR
jgi:hypothetical protein